MAFDCSNHRKPLLFSELFKIPRNTATETKLDGSSPSSSSTHFLSSYDSSSSGFSTPLCSDLGTESEDDGFIAELTRQMAECMLQEEEEEEEESVVDNVSEASSAAKNNATADENYSHSGNINDLKNGLYPSTDQMQSNIQVYQVKNQPPVSREGSFCRGRRVKQTESAQKKRIQKTEQRHMQSRARDGYSVSGMQAVFLGGSGPIIGPPGTGVFLPRDQVKLKNKSGCSTVLIPTRVLQVLGLQFSRFQESAAPPLSGSSPKAESASVDGLHNKRSMVEARPADSDAKVQLPQEWTY